MEKYDEHSPFLRYREKKRDNLGFEASHLGFEVGCGGLFVNDGRTLDLRLHSRYHGALKEIVGIFSDMVSILLYVYSATKEKCVSSFWYSVFISGKKKPLFNLYYIRNRTYKKKITALQTLSAKETHSNILFIHFFSPKICSWNHPCGGNNVYNIIFKWKLLPRRTPFMCICIVVHEILETNITELYKFWKIFFLLWWRICYLLHSEYMNVCKFKNLLFYVFENWTNFFFVLSAVVFDSHFNSKRSRCS